MTITVSLGHSSTTTIEREVFAALFHASVLSDAADFQSALDDGRIRFNVLVALARKAEIPYSLFFAPYEMVDQQIRRKSEILISGVGKDAFSLNSRGGVELANIELIIKDLLRKQMLLRKYEGAGDANPIVECLRNSARSITDDASTLRSVLGVDLDRLKAARTKGDAFVLLVDWLEARDIFVSQSARNFMPQQIPKKVRFSGMAVRDKRFPFIFLNNRDEEENYEPTGRRVLTLVLMAVCIARGKFRAVSYNDTTGDLITGREYELAEEVLMPAAEVSVLSIESLHRVKEHAAVYNVTPSAFIMRARRLGLVTHDEATAYLASLKQEYASASKPPMRQPKPETALRKYNGVEYSRRLLAQMDAGKIQQAEVVRVLFQNKLAVAQINDFRQAL